MLEILIVLGVIGIIAILALPGITSALQGYRLHSDTSAIAGSLNVTRMRAASQYSPYALDIDSTSTPATFVVEKLTGATYNPLSPSSVSYASLSPAVYEMGTQYVTIGNTLSICRPSAITAYPGPITANPSSCSGPFQICFNTRGLPVLCAAVGVNPAGSPLLNGGSALYITNQNGLTNAVTIATGGAVQSWNWSAASVQWYLR